MILGLVILNVSVGMFILRQVWFWMACPDCGHAREDHCKHGCEVCMCPGWP